LLSSRRRGAHNLRSLHGGKLCLSLHTRPLRWPLGVKFEQLSRTRGSANGADDAHVRQAFSPRGLRLDVIEDTVGKVEQLRTKLVLPGIFLALGFSIERQMGGVLVVIVVDRLKAEVALRADYANLIRV